MKKLNEQLGSGLIPIVEVAKILYPYLNSEDGVDLNNPEFLDGKLLIRVIGDRDGCGVTEYLYFEDNQFKLLIYDNYWTSDISKKYSETVPHNHVELYKKLVGLGVTTYNELGL